MFKTPSANDLGRIALKAWTSQPGIPPMFWTDCDEKTREAWRFVALAVAQVVQKANEPQTDIVRVLRMIEMVGPRERVEATLAKSNVKGTKVVGDLTFREAIVGDFPEVVESTPEKG
jgi:hypothetical protein